MKKRIQEVKDMFSGVNLPNIYLIHGDFTIDEMSTLYNHPKIGAFITCTHGEGYHPWENLISNFQTIFVLDLCSGHHHLTWRKERNLNRVISSLWRVYCMFLPSRSINISKS